MNALKSLVMIGFLAAVGYVVYVSITKPPRQTADPGLAPAFNPKEKSAGGLAPPGAPAGKSTPGTTAPSPVDDADLVLPSVTGGTPASPASLPRTRPGSAGSGPLPSAPSTLASLPSTAPGPAPGAGVIPATVPAGGPVGTGPGPAADAVVPAGASSAAGLDPESQARYNAFVDGVLADLDAGNYELALKQLTRVYQMRDLPPAQSEQIAKLLGQVAGTVIWSRKHLLEQPYRVQPGETLAQIADRYSVSPEVLAKINGIADPQRLAPGIELKVIRGPFRAEVSLERRELVLDLNGRYAGRFPIGIGYDVPVLQGHYVVKDKIANPVYTNQGLTIIGNDPQNPYGRLLLDLGQGVAIHGSNRRDATGRTDGRGTIALEDRDIEDVFAILSVGSQVIVR